MHVDVAVLGAGPGGYVAAIRAAQLGKSVAVVEGRYWGGVCLNVGCVPAKALLRNAEVASIFKHQASTYGMAGEVNFDYGAAVDRSRQVADGREKGVHFLMKKNTITQLEGWGTYRDPHTLDVALNVGTTETLTFDSTIVATGANTRLLPGIELSDNVVTYESMILSRDLPDSVIIIGAGAIGMEFAYLLRSYGARVTMLEYLDRPLPQEDIEVSKEIARQYRKLGIEIVTGAEVTNAEDRGDEVVVTYALPGGAAEVARASKVLVSVGFIPRSDGFGLENTGVALDARGAVVIDDYMRTSVPHVYAIGDVTAKLQLAHVAEAQGVVAAETIAGVETMSLGDYRMMPRATFGRPQVASFGLTEAQARETGRQIQVAKFPLSANAKAHALAEPLGFVKLVADAEHGELLGGHLIGPDVSELLPELTLAQKWDLTANELARNVHTHPTLSEALQEAFHGLSGHMVNL